MGIIYFDDDYHCTILFGFENFRRSEVINYNKSFDIKLKKTGTTIAGLIFKQGVVLGADTRATNGKISCDNNCQKIHYLAPNISCMGAGTSADAENINKLLFYQLELQRLSAGRESNVLTSLTICKNYLYKNNGNISAALVLGGFDIHGPQLFSVHPHGSSESLPFVAMGSGCLSAISILENGYDCHLDLNSALILIKEAILAGIFNDLGSGNNIDICVILSNSMIFNRNTWSSNGLFQSNSTSMEKFGT